jgi:TRAP-type C4-dicarboxylate transport system permease small subunit
MKRILDAIDRIADITCVAFMSVGFIITFFHIIGRYILREPIFFSEELARYCFIWSCMIGASVVNRRDEHTSVTFFTMLLPKKGQAWLYLAREAVIIILLIFLIYFGIELSFTMRTVHSAALDLSWAWIYMALPVASLLLIITTLRLIAAKTRELKSLQEGR